VMFSAGSGCTEARIVRSASSKPIAGITILRKAVQVPRAVVESEDSRETL
jgi:hypothetical protein